MKAWFFFHVYETLEALKERAKTSTWRPHNETIIDMCLSSDDDDQIEGDTPLFKIVEKYTPSTGEKATVTTKEAWGLRDSKEIPTSQRDQSPPQSLDPSERRREGIVQVSVTSSPLSVHLSEAHCLSQ